MTKKIGETQFGGSMDNIVKIQNKSGLARQIVRAVDNGAKIADSIAKDDGNWKKITVDGRKALANLYAFAEKCEAEDYRGE
jgi:hypothetical protein